MVALVATVFVGAVAQLTPNRQVADFQDWRKGLVRGLLQEAEDGVGKPKELHQAAVAIRKLGLMRAAEATKFLVAHIDFDPRREDVIAVGVPVLETTLPCAYALAQIGPPAFQEVVALAAQTDDSGRRRCVAYVFVRSLGKDFAPVYLQHRADTWPDADGKRRILAVRALLAKMPDIP